MQVLSLNSGRNPLFFRYTLTRIITAIPLDRQETMEYQIYIVEYQCGSIDISQSQAHAAEQKPKNAIYPTDHL